MKMYFWIYLVVFIIVTPLFIYDMYVKKKINITFVIAVVLLFIFYKNFFKK